MMGHHDDGRWDVGIRGQLMQLWHLMQLCEAGMEST